MGSTDRHVYWNSFIHFFSLIYIYDLFPELRIPTFFLILSIYLSNSLPIYVPMYLFTSPCVCLSIPVLPSLSPPLLPPLKWIIRGQARRLSLLSKEMKTNLAERTGCRYEYEEGRRMRRRRKERRERGSERRERREREERNIPLLIPFMLSIKERNKRRDKHMWWFFEAGKERGREGQWYRRERRWRKGIKKRVRVEMIEEERPKL